MLNAFDNQINFARHSIYSKILLFSVLTALLLVLAIVLANNKSRYVNEQKEDG